MVDGRWRISVVPPDWGQDHLSLEAIVAFVDGELAPGPRSRADLHLHQCRDCAAQVWAQQQARTELRAAAGPIPPPTLLRALRTIPLEADLPPPPAGLAVTADGQIVAEVRPEQRPFPPRGFPTAAPAPPTTTPQAPRPAAGARAPQPPPRRRRFGTGVALSGLALGALALGAPAASMSSPVDPSAERGVLGASRPSEPRAGSTPPFSVLGGAVGGGPTVGAPGVIDAQLRLSPPSTTSDAVITTATDASSTGPASDVPAARSTGRSSGPAPFAQLR